LHLGVGREVVVVSEEPAPAVVEESRKERKARLAAEKQAAKEAKVGDKQAAKDARQAERIAELEAKLARYKQLRANVRRRRFAYGLFIVLDIVVIAATVWDILYNHSDFELYVFAAYGVLFLFGLILLFSRRKHLEEVAEMARLERVVLEDPSTGELFQLGASKLPDLVGLEFSSPATGRYYRMPALDSQRVERPAPDAAAVVKPFHYEGITGEVATFGKEPADIKFRKASN
jgi:hypothetical protein